MTLEATNAPARTIRRWVIASTAILLLAGAGFVYVRTGGKPSAVPGEKRPITPETVSAQPNQSAWLRDVTATSGVRFTCRTGEEARHLTILESLGGGLAVLDYDGDGLLDLFVAGGGTFAKARDAYPADESDYLKAVASAPPRLIGQPCKLYRNRGDWTFEDVTAAVGLERTWGYTHGCAVADYDRDGWPDLLVTGYGQVVLLHNEPDGKGGRRFVDVAARLGLTDCSWSTSAGWADLDGDGWPDLYICHYVDWSFSNHPQCKARAAGGTLDVCPPQRFKPLVHALFHNDKGRGFREVGSEQDFQAVGAGLGVVLADVNEDGRPDIYVANDGNNKLLYLNRGGKLEECGVRAGVALDDNGHINGSMGLDVGDYDGSGRASLWVTNFQGDLHNLYRNLGHELFQDQSRAAGVAAIGMHFVAFGTGFIDVDHDGWEDLVIVNGHVVHFPIMGSTYKQRPVLLHNVAYQGRRFFKDASALAGPFFQEPTLGRGLVVGDLDNDGWSDVVISHSNSPVAILRNDCARTQASPAAWLGVKLVGKDHRDVVGSTVVLECEGRKLTRFAKGGGSYLSSGDRRLLFGLGTAQRAQRVTVRWSWGPMQEFRDLEAGHYWELHEGDPVPRVVEPRVP